MKGRLEKERYPLLTRRAVMLGGVQAALVGVLAGRLYYLQVIEADQYKMLSDENRVNMRFIAPLRGRILDRHGTPLAANRRNFRVVIVPEQAESVEDTLWRLNRIVPISEYDRARVLKEAGRRRKFVPISVVDNLSWRDFARINVRSPNLPGIQLDVGDTRDYPFGPDVAHTVGYVAAVSEKDLEKDKSEPLMELPGFRIGRQGMERSQEQQLRGVAGSQRVEVNAFGRVIRELSRIHRRPGADVTLTLDADLQRYAMAVLQGRSGASVVMDVHDGDILAMASTPSFDPNAFNVGMTEKEWMRLNRDPKAPMTNKALAGRYPPGSTFKMVVMLAALEHRVISPNFELFCSGKQKLGDHIFHCWRRGGHGWMTPVEALAQSCDVFFYEIARRVGIGRIVAMAEKLGLGRKLLPDMPGEVIGLVPTKEWKLGAIGEPWQVGETLIAGIGQGYLLTTPLQLATMTARIANGKWAVTPRILNRPPTPPPPLDLSRASLNLVRNGMLQVMEGELGTARGSRLPDNRWRMAGKTGTSQVRRISIAERESGVRRNEDMDWRFRDHALFVAYAPFEKPRYAISVIVEHGGSGSRTAAPLARDILYRTLQLDPSSTRIVGARAPEQDG